jgi:hypothetical protein
MSIFSTSLVLILCGFEKDFCHWEHLPAFDYPAYSWFRNSTLDLENLGLPGPTGDILGQKNTYFAIASNMMPPDGMQGSTADLISPYLIGEVHKVECFGFWLYFAVSCP